MMAMVMMMVMMMMYDDGGGDDNGGDDGGGDGGGDGGDDGDDGDDDDDGGDGGGDDDDDGDDTMRIQFLLSQDQRFRSENSGDSSDSYAIYHFNRYLQKQCKSVYRRIANSNTISSSNKFRWNACGYECDAAR